MRINFVFFIYYVVLIAIGCNGLCRSKSSIRIPRYSQQPLFLFEQSLESLAATNAEILAIKEQNWILGVKTGGVKSVTRCPINVMKSKASSLAKLLERDGVVSIPNVLSSETADEYIAYINEENETSKKDVTSGSVSFDSRFGGVNCRGQNGSPFGNRQDTYLPMCSDIVRKALKELVNNLAPLLLETVTEDAMLHEVSSFVADHGSPRQCIHADTIVLPCPQYPHVSMEPLYTIFIALQDVEDDMGHTQFLLQTHTPAAHLLWNVDQNKKEKFLLQQNVVQSGMKKGDVTIFDSRILHCGCANSSKKRRVIAYYTLSKQHRWPLPEGLHGSNSIREEDRWQYQLKDFLD